MFLHLELTHTLCLQHVKAMEQLVKSGIISAFYPYGPPRYHRVPQLASEAHASFTEMGGPLLSPKSIGAADSEKKMVGSMMVIEASSFDEVRNIIENDIYYTSDVVGGTITLSMQLGLIWLLPVGYRANHYLAIPFGAVQVR